MRDQQISPVLLAWYDENARDLPWRIAPDKSKAGIRPDPYHVWLSEIMLQQTTVAAVKSYYVKFLHLWPDVHALADAKDAEVMAQWAGLGYYARARNLLKCARVVSGDLAGVFPNDYKSLLTLPGIGPYTAAAISSIAFNQMETVVDGNVERVMARIFNIEKPLPASKPDLAKLAQTQTPKQRAGDYAQAVMDLGATICTPKSPACNTCPITQHCAAQAAGTAASLPKRTPKPPKPHRKGIAYVVQRSDGAWLLEQRPDKGLLGGMLGWPCTVWGDSITPCPPLETDWLKSPETVRHTFTHFHLELEIHIAKVGHNAVPETGHFVEKNAFDSSVLPTVMRKAHSIAMKAMQQD